MSGIDENPKSEGRRAFLKLGGMGVAAGGAAVALRGETHGTRPSSYTVQKGDSLWLISRRFGVSVAQLQQWNSLERGSVLRPGQNLIIALPSGDTGV